MNIITQLRNKLKQWYGERWNKEPEDDYWKGVNMGVNITFELLCQTLEEKN